MRLSLVSASNYVCCWNISKCRCWASSVPNVECERKMGLGMSHCTPFISNLCLALHKTLCAMSNPSFLLVNVQCNRVWLQQIAIVFVISMFSHFVLFACSNASQRPSTIHHSKSSVFLFATSMLWSCRRRPVVTFRFQSAIGNSN